MTPSVSLSNEILKETKKEKSSNAGVKNWYKLVDIKIQFVLRVI